MSRPALRTFLTSSSSLFSATRATGAPRIFLASTIRLPCSQRRPFSSASSPPPTPPSPPPPPSSSPPIDDNDNDEVDTSDYIFEVDTSTMMNKITKFDKPIILDFYADWCAPCKALTPQLEQYVKSLGGKVLLGKLNVDNNPQVAEAFNVKVLPTLVGLNNGKVVKIWAGGKESPMELLEAMKALADNNDLDARGEEANLALTNEDVHTAASLFNELHSLGWTKSRCLAGLARCALLEGSVELASDIAKKIRSECPDDIDKFEDVKQALTLIDLKGKSSGSISELETQVAANPDDAELAINLATAYFSSGKTAEALDTCLGVLRKDPTNTGHRETMINFINAIGKDTDQGKAAMRRFTNTIFL